MSDAAKKKAKPRWAIEKPKLDNARQLRGIFFIESNDEEFKLTMKAARRKLEVPTPSAMPCKIPTKSSGKKPTEILGKLHQDHITAKGISSLTLLQIYSDASRILNSRCKGSSGERMRQTGEIPGMTADESQKQERSDR